jgi:hypothetical protein
MVHRRLTIRLFIALMTLSAAGCQSPYMRWPDLSGPGTADYQRSVAERYDPYLSPDAGPEVVGGRPLGYQRPLTETEWGRRYARPDGALQPVPIPTIPPPPVVTAPYPPSPPVQTSPFPVQPRSPF